MEKERTNKVCPNCKKTIYFDEWLEYYKERAKHRYRRELADIFWNKKKFCSGKCAGEFKSKQTKPCEHCGQVFHRKPLDTKGNWERKKFCSQKCALEYGFIKKLSMNMGIPYETLKEELIKIAEKYSNG